MKRFVLQLLGVSLLITASAAPATAQVTTELRQFKAALSVASVHNKKLGRVGCLDLTSCEPDDRNVRIGVGVEYSPTSFTVLGVNVNRHQFGVTQQLGGLDVNRVDVTAIGTTAYGGGKLRILEPLTLMGTVGLSRVFNSGDVLTTAGTQEFTESRSQSDWRVHAGLHAELRVTNRVGVRLSYDALIGDRDEPDADETRSFGLSFTYAF